MSYKNIFQGILSSTVVTAGYDDSMVMSHVTFYGVASIPNSITVDGFAQDFVYEEDTKV